MVRGHVIGRLINLVEPNPVMLANFLIQCNLASNLIIFVQLISKLSIVCIPHRNVKLKSANDTYYNIRMFKHWMHVGKSANMLIFRLFVQTNVFTLSIFVGHELSLKQTLVCGKSLMNTRS